MPKEAPPKEDRITVDHREAARLLSISERHLFTLVQAGKIRRVKAGNKNLFPVLELYRFAEENLLGGSS